MAIVIVRLYAQARGAVGVARIRVEIPDGGTDLTGFLRLLGAGHARLESLLPVCRVVRNGAYVGPGRDRIRPGDDLAIHPPYSGG